MRSVPLITILLVLALAPGPFIRPNSAAAATAAEIDSNVKNALEKLFAKSASARAMSEKAKGILVFPSIVKGGFLVGGQYGEGALVKDGRTSGYLCVFLRSEGPHGRPWLAGHKNHQDREMKGPMRFRSLFETLRICIRSRSYRVGSHS